MPGALSCAQGIMAGSASAKLAALKEKAAKQVGSPPREKVSHHIARSGSGNWPSLQLMHVVRCLQDQELESAFDAGPSSSQQEFSMKGVGTFRVSGEESDRLLRKKAPQVCSHL